MSNYYKRYYKRKYSNYFPRYKTTLYGDSRVTSLLRNYSKLKLSVCWFIKVHTTRDNGFYIYDGENRGSPVWNLAQMFVQCEQYNVIRTQYAYYKVTGLALEFIPTAQNQTYVLANQVYDSYRGSVAFGLSSEGDFENLATRLAYEKIVELDKSIVLDPINRQRKYWYLNMSDYIKFPPAGNYTSMPFFMHSNNLNIAGSPQNINWPIWTFKATFYVTCKDKIL